MRIPIIGGDTGDNKIMETEIQRVFEERLSSLSYFGRSGGYPGIFEVLQDMQNRLSKNPMDKVAGLAYLLQTREIPAYYETQSRRGCMDSAGACDARVHSNAVALLPLCTWEWIQSLAPIVEAGHAYAGDRDATTIAQS